MPKKDLTKMLSAQAASRKNEINSIVSGEPEEKKRGRKPAYSDDDPKCNVTLVLPTSLRDKVKLYAVKNHTTMSELFAAWIEDHCDEV